MIFLHRVRVVMEGMIPPSVNHYKVPIVIHGHISFKVTPEAKAFKQFLALEAMKARARELQPWNGDTKNVRYRLRVVVYLGKKQRGDYDNFLKLVGDGLKDCGAIHSDDAIDEGHMYKRRNDRDRPRTEITVWSYLERKSGR